MKKIIMGLLITICTTTIFAQTKELRELSFNYCNNDSFTFVSFDSVTKVVTVKIKMATELTQESLRAYKNIQFTYCYKAERTWMEPNTMEGIMDTVIAVAQKNKNGYSIDVDIYSKIKKASVSGKELTCSFQLNERQFSFLHCAQGLPSIASNFSASRLNIN